jgi:hypothetical protein
LDPEALPNGDDLRYSRISIENSDRFAPLNSAKELAQFGFEFGNAHLLHDHI